MQIGTLGPYSITLFFRFEKSDTIERVSMAKVIDICIESIEITTFQSNVISEMSYGMRSERKNLNMNVHILYVYKIQTFWIWCNISMRIKNKCYSDNDKRVT